MFLYNAKWNLLVLLAFQRRNNLNSHSARKMFTAEEKKKKKEKRSVFSSKTALESSMSQDKGCYISSPVLTHDGKNAGL